MSTQNKRWGQKLSKVYCVLIYIACFLKPVQNGSVRDFITLSLEDKKLLLNEHNKYRRQAQPTGSNMEEMIWDPELARFAEDHSRKCEFSHSSGGSTSKFNPIGENLYITSSVSISNNAVGKNGLVAWFNEYLDYNYTSNTCSAGKVCGHYTQMVWANSYAVGCGITSCDDLHSFSQGTLLVCNYGPAGNYAGQKPYESGESCAQCPAGMTCADSLCRDGNRESVFSRASLLRTSSFSSILVLLMATIAIMNLYES